MCYTQNQMPYSLSDIPLIIDAYARGAFTNQQRRHSDWTTNYLLGRDKVQINRLIQRQSVNIPLMKWIIKSALKEVDDPVDLYFRNRNNDKEKELFLNHYWSKVKDDNKIDQRDVVDKKQEAYVGRTTTAWNIVDGEVVLENDDSFDVFFDQYTDPLNIDGTFHYIDHRHIFKTLDSVVGNKNYRAKARANLQKYFLTNSGTLKAAQNAQSLTEKNQRAQEMGVPNVQDPEVGQTYVEINKHWLRLWDEENQEECIYYAESAMGDTRELLLFEKQEDIIGPTADNYWRKHCIKTSWAGDPELNDMYSDSLADVIRPINVVANANFSQDTENRTLRNYGMNYYNNQLDNFFPTTYEPEPWGWYPIPVPTGMSIQDVIMNVPVQPLSDNLAAMQFLIGIAEKAAAVSTTQSGQINQQKVTLGEIELTLQEAKDRLKASSVYYLPAWQERGVKFVKLIEAAGDKIDAVKVFKKGYRGNMFGRDVNPSDAMTPDGYDIEVTRKSDVQHQALETINVLNAVKSTMPGNEPLQEIYDKKLLELVPNITPDQMREVIDFQKQLRAKQASMPALMPGNTPGNTPAGNAPTPPMAQLPAGAGA